MADVQLSQSSGITGASRPVYGSWATLLGIQLHLQGRDGKTASPVSYWRSSRAATRAYGL